MQIVPFLPEHLDTLALQPSQADFLQTFDKTYAPALIAAGPCFTAIKDGVILGCAGLTKQWDNRAIAWALFSTNLGREFVRIHRAAERYLAIADFKRIEAFVDANFAEGHRWIQMLGFEREGYMRSFSPNGNDAVLYARVK
jgi:hypothetical protein